MLRLAVVSGKSANWFLASVLRINTWPTVLNKVMPKGTCVRISMAFGSSLTRFLARSKDGRLKETN